MYDINLGKIALEPMELIDRVWLICGEKREHPICSTLKGV